MKVQVARIILPDGTERVEHPRDGKKFSLEELQGFVEGWIELIHLPRGNGRVRVYVNEDGKLNGLPRNEKATAIYGGDDYIVGPMVIVACAKAEGRKA